MAQKNSKKTTSPAPQVQVKAVPSRAGEAKKRRIALQKERELRNKELLMDGELTPWMLAKKARFEKREPLHEAFASMMAQKRAGKKSKDTEGESLEKIKTLKADRTKAISAAVAIASASTENA